MSSTTPPEPTRVVLIAADDPPEPGVEDPQAPPAHELHLAMVRAGFHVAAVLPVDAFLPDRLQQIEPDMIVVDAQASVRDTLEHVVLATRDQRRPIVLFTDDNDTTFVRDAIAAGVVAYVVDGLAPDRVRPVLEVAMARFDYEQRLRRDLAEARSQLEDRKLLDRAKGILMKRHGIDEPAAHGRLRKAAMDQGLKMSAVAQRVIDAAELLG
jgi:response regulator NasT